MKLRQNKLEEFNKRFPVDIRSPSFSWQSGQTGSPTPEGTGEELFQRIQAEKQNLVNAGEVYREKQLTAIADDEVHLIFLNRGFGASWEN